MKKNVFALVVLAASCASAFAQSSVTLYGIVDAGVRYTTNAGTGGTGSLKALIPGGMSQSRLGVNVVEDLGGGLKGLVNLEHRLLSDTGNSGAANFWQQSWVGVQSNDFGRITLGRQYNLLFDVYTSTYASYKYSPYVEAYKPEIGMSLGARNDNMVKWVLSAGALTGAVQVSAGEGGAGKTMGFMGRYADAGFALGGAYLDYRDGFGKKAKATTLGGSYTSGPLYLSLAWAQNKFDAGFNGVTNATFAAAFVGPLLSSTAANASKRDMISFGGTYQVTPEFNLGAHYWMAKQTGFTSAGDGKGKFFNVIGDYAFSKRTDAYVGMDMTRFSGGLAFANGAKTRSGLMAGVRHRF